MSRKQDIVAIIRGAQWLTGGKAYLRLSSPTRLIYQAQDDVSGMLLRFEAFDQTGRFEVLEDEGAKPDLVPVDVMPAKGNPEICDGRLTLNAVGLAGLSDNLLRRMAHIIRTVMSANGA